MKAILPKANELKVKIIGQDNWFFDISQTNTGWAWGDWNDTENSRTFTSTKKGEIDFEIELRIFQIDDYTSPDSVNIIVYENSNTPTWSKTIHIGN
jgi:hypothetical protein